MKSSKFTLGFILTKVLSYPIVFLILMYTERRIELLTDNTFYIALTYCIFLFSICLYHLVIKVRTTRFNNQLSAKRILYFIIAISLLLMLGQDHLVWWSYYIILSVITLISLIFSSTISTLFYLGVKFNKRAKVTTRIEFYSSLVGMLSFIVVALYVRDEIILLCISCILSLLSLLSLRISIKIWNSVDTKDHFILNQHQINASVTEGTNRYNFKLRDSIGVKTVLAIFIIYQLLLGIVEVLNVIYIQDIVDKTQFDRFLLIGIFLAGVFTSSRFISYSVSKIRASYLLQSSILLISIYAVILYQNVSIYYLYVVLYLLGLVNGLVLTTTRLAVHQNSKEFQVRGRLKLIEVGLYLLPFISYTTVLGIYVYSTIALDMIFLSVAVITTILLTYIILIRFFKPKTRDMSYKIERRRHW